MGMWSRLFPPVPDFHTVDQLRPQIEAWTNGDVLADVAFNLGLDPRNFPLSRAAAMSVPAMARARNLTCGTVAAQPLEALRGATPTDPQPYWCQGTDGQTGTLTREQLVRWRLGPQSPYGRMLWTVDDLLFQGESMWLTTARLSTGQPSRFLRLPYDVWEVQPDGTVTDPDSQPFNLDDLVWFDGANEGVLSYGANTLRIAAELEANARDVAMRPLRLEAHQTTDAELTPTERRDITTSIRTAMRDNDGVIFTNNAIELVEHRVDSDALQLGARNASALDVARDANMPALMIDATAQGASLEYQTATGRNQEWLDLGLSIYFDPITSRLSMDDIVPAGQRIAFDLSDLTAPTGSATGYPTID